MTREVNGPALCVWCSLGRGERKGLVVGVVQTGPGLQRARSVAVGTSSVKVPTAHGIGKAAVVTTVLPGGCEDSVGQNAWRPLAPQGTQHFSSSSLHFGKQPYAP